jgi:hypothetical protein
MESLPKRLTEALMREALRRLLERFERPGGVSAA